MREQDGKNLNFYPFLGESNFTTSIFFILLHFLFSSCVGLDPAGSPRMSAADVASALLLPSLLNHGSNTLQMNKHLHPLSVKARRLLHSSIQDRGKEREGEMESWRRSTGKEWQMEGWINVEMNQQQSNKATQDFLVLPLIRLICLPLDTIITVLLIIFSP